MRDRMEMISTCGEYKGHRTGFAKLDSALSRLQAERLIVIGGRPGQGKSALAVSIGDRLVSDGIPVLMFSLEMSSAEILNRLVSMRAMVDNRKVQNADFPSDEIFERVRSAMIGLKKSQWIIRDNLGATLPELESAMSQEFVKRPDIGLVIVDYIGLLKAPIRQRRHEFLGDVTRYLKSAARAFRVPVIALSQLNRAVEGEKNREPILSDLRESGDIEQNSDAVILIQRHDTQGDPTSEVKLFLRKNRFGPVCTVMARFKRQYTLFTEVDDERAWDDD
jgi:replicative DNA helicase